MTTTSLSLFTWTWLKTGIPVTALVIFPAVLNVWHKFSRSLAGHSDSGIFTTTWIQQSQVWIEANHHHLLHVWKEVKIFIIVYLTVNLYILCPILNFYFPQYKISSFGLQENEVFFQHWAWTGINASVLLLLGNIKTISYIYWALSALTLVLLFQIQNIRKIRRSVEIKTYTWI